MEEENFPSIIQCFRYERASGNAYCRIKTDGILCRQKISNNHHGNKMRHLKKFHPNIHIKLIKIPTKRKAPNVVKSIRVKINMEVIYAAFIELVSKNGRPFRIAEDSGMRLIIDPILDGVYRETGQRHTINRTVIEQKVCDAFAVVSNRIKEEMQKKPIMIMIDIATKHNRSILGVNVRFFSGNKYKIRTLSMRELTKSHSTANIYELLNEFLTTFEINPIQIYVFISDNAYNVTNVSNRLDEDCEEQMVDGGFCIDDEMFSLINNKFFGEMLTGVEEMMSKQNSHVNFVPCAAHSIQLSVSDALKESSLAAALQMAKDVVKEIRTPKISRILRERKLNQALMDHDIRWSYKYKMVRYIFNYYRFMLKLN